MINYFIGAKLISLRKVSLAVFSTLKIDKSSVFTLIVDNQEPIVLKVNKHSSDPSHDVYELELPFDFPFGKQCYINVNSFNSVLIDNSNAPYFPEFDFLFNYHGKLGCFIENNITSFYLWAPLSSSVFLKLENNDGSFSTYLMDRIENGVYFISINKNLSGKKYHYLVNNNGVFNEVNDPYGKFASLNSEYSVCYDLNEVVSNFENIKPSSKISSASEAIIYELDVRDFTEDAKEIENKGKYLGLIEENKKSDKGNPIGLDYLKELGITHIQILPILDFYDKGDDNDSYYNWGYDPISFFAIQGSYSTNPSDPLARINEFRKVVDTMHKNNIRVVLDVVYNHVYEYETSIFNKIVPNYYFRRRKDGPMACSSGCGNDFASERFMAKRLILDSIKYLFETFDIDGLRFDLMGLIDIDTISKVNALAKQIKDDAIIYGEGWDMGYELPIEEKSCSANASKLKDVGFFNDTYRDVIKGGSFKTNRWIKGYLTGDLSYVFGMDYVLHGCTLPYSYDPKFIKTSQSINYVECHDNYTLFDKLSSSNNNEDEQTRLQRLSLINSVLLLSFGVPFIHMGQEIGQSKNDNDNTYNVLKINNFNFDLYDERISLVKDLENVIKLRKQLPELSYNDPRNIKNEFAVEHLENGLYLIKNLIKNYLFIINPTLKEKTISFDEDRKIIFKQSFVNDDIMYRSIEIEKLSFILVK